MTRTTLAALVAVTAVLTAPAFAQTNSSRDDAPTASRPNAQLPTDTPPSDNRASATEPAETTNPQSSLKSAVRKSRSAAATSTVTTGPTAGADRPNPGS